MSLALKQNAGFNINPRIKKKMAYLFPVTLMLRGQIAYSFLIQYLS